MRITQASMSPQDIVVLLKVIVYGANPWNQMKLADALSLSQPEISNSLARSKFAGLLDDSSKNVRHLALIEFLGYGIAYAFPAQPGPIVRGVPTAHSAPPLINLIQSSGEEYVWPSATGELRGQAISPLYKGVVKAIKEDHSLYEMLALIDAIRVGRVREKHLAMEELKKRIQC